MTKPPRNKLFQDPQDEEYLGNIWGWKISFMGLALILFFGGLIIYRHYTLDVPFGLEDPDTKVEQVDSTQLEGEKVGRE